MNQMPGWTAEASLSTGNVSYRAFGVVSDASTGQVVLPQACNWWDWILCGGFIAGCTAVCVATGPGFIPCMTACLGAAGAVGCAACLTP
jgi:hypothetical protein